MSVCVVWENGGTELAMQTPVPLASLPHLAIHTVTRQQDIKYLAVTSSLSYSVICSLSLSYLVICRL